MTAGGGDDHDQSGRSEPVREDAAVTKNDTAATEAVGRRRPPASTAGTVPRALLNPQQQAGLGDARAARTLDQPH